MSTATCVTSCRRLTAAVGVAIMDVPTLLASLKEALASSTYSPGVRRVADAAIQLLIDEGNTVGATSPSAPVKSAATATAVVPCAQAKEVDTRVAVVGCA